MECCVGVEVRGVVEVGGVLKCVEVGWCVVVKVGGVLRWVMYCDGGGGSVCMWWWVVRVLKSPI